MPTDATDNARKDRLRAAGFTAEEADAVICDVYAMNEWVSAGGILYLQALLNELLVGTLAATGGLAAIIPFQSSTLAWTLAADLVFSAAFSKVLKRAR